MKIVVTGGAGFVGKPVLKLLLQNGHEVLALSRQPQAPMELSKNPSLRWHACDLTHLDSWHQAVRDFAPERCLHLAWDGLPDYGLEQSLKNLVMGAQLVDYLVLACSATLLSADLVGSMARFLAQFVRGLPRFAQIFLPLPRMLCGR